MNRPLLLGHRGARALRSIPENTLASFDRALADGCDGFEFDVRLSRDGEAVLCHDARWRGIEIAKADANALPSLARFSLVLQRYQSVFLDIELKVRGLEKLTSDLLKKFPPASGYVVSSFLPGALQAMHKIDEKIPLGLICETRNQLKLWKNLPLQFVIPKRTLLTKELLGTLKSAGKRVLVWTVNRESEMKRLAAWGVDGIVSDKTRLLADVLK